MLWCFRHCSKIYLYCTLILQEYITLFIKNKINKLQFNAWFFCFSFQLFNFFISLYIKKALYLSWTCQLGCYAGNWSSLALPRRIRTVSLKCDSVITGYAFGLHAMFVRGPTTPISWWNPNHPLRSPWWSPLSFDRRSCDLSPVTVLR